MTDFVDLISDQTILQALGDDVIYLGTGESNVAIKAMVSYGTQNTYASDAYVPEHNVSAWRYHYPSLPAEINRH